MADQPFITRVIEQLDPRAAVAATDLVAVQAPGGPTQKASLSQLTQLMGDQLGVALANPSAGKRYATTAAAHADAALLAGMYFDVVPSENGGAYDVRLRTGGGSTLITTTANLATIGTEIAALAAGTAQAAYLAKTGYGLAAGTDVPRGITARAFVGGTGYTNGAYKIYSADSNFAIKPCVSVTVAGGVITVVTIINKGLYLGAAPTTPTISLASLGAGTGGSITLTVGFIEANHYWVLQADTQRLRLFVNSAGVATAFAPTQYRAYNPVVEMAQSAVPQPYVLVPKSGQIAVVGSDQIYSWTQSPSVGANSTVGAVGENVLLTIAALMAATVALLPTGKQVPLRHLAVSAACAVRVKTTNTGISTYELIAPSFDAQTMLIMCEQTNTDGAAIIAKLMHGGIEFPRDGTFSNVNFRTLMKADRSAPSPSFTLYDFDGTTLIITAGPVYSPDGIARPPAKSWLNGDTVDFKREATGKVVVVRPAETVTPTLSTMAMALALPGVIQHDKRGIQLYKADPNTFQVNLCPPKVAPHYRAPIKWNRSDVTTFMLRPDLILGGELIINSITGQRATRYAQLCNFLFTDLISGITTSNGLVPTTIEGVMSLGLLGAAPVNGVNYQLAGPGHGHEIMVTPSVMTGTTNDAATANVDVISNNLETMPVGKGFSGTKLVVATTVDLTIPDGRTCARSTRTLTMEPASTYQLRIQSSHNFGVGAVTAAIAYGYAGMLGLSDCDRVCGVVNGVAGPVVNIGNGDGMTIPLGMAEKVVAWHSLNPNVRIEIECADGFGYSHRENGVLVARTDNVLVIDNPYGSKVYFAIDGASNDARSLAGIIMTFDFFYRVVGADSIT